MNQHERRPVASPAPGYVLPVKPVASIERQHGISPPWFTCNRPKPPAFGQSRHLRACDQGRMMPPGDGGTNSRFVLRSLGIVGGPESNFRFGCYRTPMMEEQPAASLNRSLINVFC